MILDLIDRCDAKVKIHWCLDGSYIVQQLVRLSWTRVALDGVIDPWTVRGHAHCLFRQRCLFHNEFSSSVIKYTQSCEREGSDKSNENNSANNVSTSVAGFSPEYLSLMPNI